MAGLGVAWANTERDADTMTLLSSADVTLRLAWGIPAVDKDGEALADRAEMIAGAITCLESVERQKPGMAITAEFFGFAHMMKGDFAAAADCYARARDCDDCGKEQFDVLAFNEARMRAKAGAGEAALAVFARHAQALDSRFGNQRAIEEASILRGLGRREEALARLDAVLADPADEPMAWVQCGIELEKLDQIDRAQGAFERARAPAPIANYHLARLKLRSGDVDTAVNCLERAAAAVPAEVRRLLREEADVWQALEGEARFEQLREPVAATPGR